MEYEQRVFKITLRLTKRGISIKTTRSRPVSPKKFFFKIDPMDMKDIIKLQNQVDTMAQIIIPGQQALSNDEREKWSDRFNALKLEKAKELDRIVKKYTDQDILNMDGFLTPLVSFANDQLILTLHT